MNVSSAGEGIYRFGLYRLDPARRLLLRDGVRVDLAARLFNTLWYLVAHHDRLVTRAELEEALWPSRSVEDNNLGQAIYALRKALQVHDPGETLIVTVPGRGYKFAGVAVFEAPGSDTAQPNPPADPNGVAQPADSPRGSAPSTGRTAALLVVALACVVAAFAVAERSTRSERDDTFAPPPHSVAILPFQNLTGESGEEYFSDGLSEELIASLGRVGALHVAAVASSFALKGKAQTSRTIGRLLNVGAVLEGTVRRDGQRFRVTVKLSDARTGYLVWLHSYDSEGAKVFTLQEEIAAAVSASIQVPLLGGDGPRLTLGGTSDPKALDAYLLGISYRRQRTQEGIGRAVAAFEQALAIDPAYVRALVKHAESLLVSADSYVTGTGSAARVRQMREQALAEATRAVRDMPDLGEAHGVLATFYEQSWDFAREGAEFARARTLAPNDSHLLIAYARFQVDAGHDADAIAAADQAASLDTLAPDIHAGVAMVMMLARRPEAARAALHHAEALGLGGMGDADLQAHLALITGDMDSARRICAAGQSWFQLFCLAVADHRTGSQAGAIDAMARLTDRLGDGAAYQYASIYAAWDQPDQALTWLEKAYRLRDDGLIDMHADAFLDPIRQTARFKSVEAGLGLFQP